jgi:hypothetical protein
MKIVCYIIVSNSFDTEKKFILVRSFMLSSLLTILIVERFEIWFVESLQIGLVPNDIVY